MRRRLLLGLLLAGMVGASAAMAQDADGQISGVVLDAVRTPIANQRVELRRLDRERSARQVVTTDSQGAFAYTTLAPGRYSIELILDGRVVTRGSPVELSPGAMRVAGLSVVRPAVWVRSDRQVSALPSPSAKRLLGTRGVAGSFEELQEVLKPGHRVVFDRKKVTVVEISRDRLILLRHRAFRNEEIVLPEDAVLRLEIVDPTANGTLIGLAIGGTLGAAMAVQTHRYADTHQDCNLCPLNYILLALWPVFGAGLGHLIDSSQNEAVFERRARTPGVALGPILGRDAIGISAQIRF